MEKIRIDLVRLKTEEDALKRFGRLKGMPADYNSELEELHGILQAWDKPLKIEIVIGGNIGPFTKLMEMLENVRTTNNNLLFVVIHVYGVSLIFLKGENLGEGYNHDTDRN